MLQTHPAHAHPLRWGLRGRLRHAGFTLVEVLVALSIVGIALAAGLRVSGSLTDQANRQTEIMLAQLCANTGLLELRAVALYVSEGENEFSCVQAQYSFTGKSKISPTLNPNFRRVDIFISLGPKPIVNFSTIVRIAR